MVSLTNLTYSIHNNIVLHDITSVFDYGEVVGITGDAGSGKSSLIKLVSGIYKNYEGDILINERNIKTYSKKEFSRLISHLPSPIGGINPEATVEDWIIGGRIYLKKKLNPYSDTDREIARREMALFGLKDLAEKRLKTVSASSVQMVSLARVFSAQSEIVLLEKPEAGLNIHQRLTLTNALKKYTSSGSRLVILASSDLNFISSSCDRIIILADNIIAESGTHGIITSDLLKRYFNIETVVTRNIYSGLPEIQVIE